MEGLYGDPQDRGRLGLIVPGELQGFQNQRPLGVLDRDPEGQRQRRGGAGAWLGRAKRLREVGRLDGLAAGQEDGPLDDIAEFPPVPRPGVALQAVQRRRGDRHRRAAVPGRRVRQERYGQQRNIVRALAQGGQSDREHVKAIEKVRPQLSVPHGRVRVLIGGGRRN